MPAGFVFENVLSITHPASRPILDRFLRRCGRLGYAVQAFKANAVEYGVPQMRQRLIVLGLKGRSIPVPPLPTHCGSEKEHREKPHLQAPVAVGPILEPFRRAIFAEREEVVSGRWAKELHQIPPGWNYKALTAWAGHRKPVFLAETRFWNFLLKLHPELPSWTIAANPGPWTGPFHWDSRRLRVPELAALQTFPIDYNFSGSKRSVRRQIGNAIPPVLARHVVDAVASEIMGSRRSIGALRYTTVA
jgi:DNA (cytosine-5)-methyltransferase 1